MTGLVRRFFQPFGYVEMSARDHTVVKTVWGVLLVLAWQLAPRFHPLIPTPGEVLTALGALYDRGLLVEVWVSASVVLVAAFLLALPAGCVLSYLATLGAFRFPIALLASLRNAPPLALIVAFLILQFGGHGLKVMTMAAIILVYFLSARLYAAQPREELDHGVCMRMSPWQILWHRVVRGKLHLALTDFVPCVGMGWAMLSMVEGLSRSQGGLGDLLLQADKISSLAGITAITLVNVALGAAITVSLRALVRWQCPYAVQVAVS